MTKKSIIGLLILNLYIFGNFLYIKSAYSKELQNTENLCSIFRQEKKWYKWAKNSERKWAVPIPILMSIIRHESGFIPNAKPPRTKCLLILPGPRPSSAYGYAQAIDRTWKSYQRATNNYSAKRTNFKDAVDFVGWYCHISYKKCGIRKNDAYGLYLVYHEGQKGFNRKTYLKKKWLMRRAKTVKRTYFSYTRQLRSCESEFMRKRGCFWPF